MCIKDVSVTRLSTSGTCIASAFPGILMQFLESSFITTLVALSPFIQHFLLLQNTSFMIKQSHVGTVKASDFKRPRSFPRKLDLLAEGEQSASQAQCCGSFKA